MIGEYYLQAYDYRPLLASHVIIIITNIIIIITIIISTTTIIIIIIILIIINIITIIMIKIPIFMNRYPIGDLSKQLIARFVTALLHDQLTALFLQPYTTIIISLSHQLSSSTLPSLLPQLSS